MTNRTVAVNVKADISDFNRAMLAGAASAKAFGAELDTSTDRATNLTQATLAFGPALVPLGAAGIPAVAGLANQLGLAATAAGVATLAFSGVGDALKAVNEYQLDPTTANFEKMSQTLDKLGPAGRDFVMFLQELRPQLQGLQDAAQAGLLPGAEDGIRDLMELMPQAEQIVSTVSQTLGDLIAEAGDSLNDPRWRDFFEFLEREARPTLLDMGHTLGNLAEGFANLWMAFSPVSAQFSTSFLGLSRDFAEWTNGLDQTQGFQEFLDYISRVGPKAWDTLGAVGNALLQIVEAAAPVGEVMLPVIQALADSLAAVADSDVGPVLIGAAAGISALSRAMALFQSANGSAFGKLMAGTTYAGAAKGMRDLPNAILQYDGAAARAQRSASGLASSTTRLGTALKGTAKVAGGGAGLAFAMSDLDNKMGLSNTAMLGLAGSAAGPWGTAAGVAAGLTMDLAAANDGLTEALARSGSAIADNTLPLDQQRAQLEASKKAFADLQSHVGDGGFFNAKGAGLSDVKNTISGWLGDSDVEKGQQGLDDQEAALKANERAAQDAAFAEAGFGNTMDKAGAAARREAADLIDNTTKKNNAKNAALEAADAELAYEAAIDNAHKAAKENGKTLDEDTPKGRANLAALHDLANTWNDLSVEQQRSAGAQKRARRELIDTAIQMGANKAQARAYADSWLEVPTQVKTDVVTRGAAKSKSDIQAIRDAIDNLPKTTNLVIRTWKETYARPAGGSRENGVPNSAAGNIFASFAAGGVEQHLPQIGNGAFSRVWNEPETKGEAYIPLADDWRRPRAEAIWHETGRLLGMEHFAAGGFDGASRAPSVHANASSPPASSMVASLKGARVVIDKDGLMEFVDGRVDLGVADIDNFKAAQRRAGRRQPGHRR